jgi:hypothetical protein
LAAAARLLDGRFRRCGERPARISHLRLGLRHRGGRPLALDRGGRMGGGLGHSIQVAGTVELPYHLLRHPVGLVLIRVIGRAYGQPGLNRQAGRA